MRILLVLQLIQYHVPHGLVRTTPGCPLVLPTSSRCLLPLFLLRPTTPGTHGLADEQLVDKLLLLSELDLPANGVEDESVPAHRHLLDCAFYLFFVV